MRITIVLDDDLHANLKAEAARRGQTMSRLVEAALWLLLERAEERPPLPPLPVFDSGGYHVNIADRDALEEAIDRRWA